MPYISFFILSLQVVLIQKLNNMKFNDTVVLLELDERQNYTSHFTDAAGLKGILNSGFLSGNKYQTSLRTKFKDDKPIFTKEISVVRPGSNPIKQFGKTEIKDSYHLINELSDKKMIAEFILFTDRILSGVRGAKKVPIAEFPLSSYNIIFKNITELNNYFEEHNTIEKYPVVKNLYIAINKHSNFIKNMNTFINVFNNNKNTFSRYKSEFNYDEKIQEKFKSIEHWAKEYEYYSKHKEGEERFIGKIPVDKKYMQIKLLPAALNTDNIEKFAIQYLVKEYNDLFIRNSVYKAVTDRNKKTFKKNSKEQEQIRTIKNKSFYKENDVDKLSIQELKNKIRQSNDIEERKILGRELNSRKN
ncbi:MAG: hypothetical protein LBF97_00275 [Elusimicrobiota bacterium]|jgi:hypothetical protein|nr:hypothetical protein [Elusimicrobiota bacterium]